MNFTSCVLKLFNVLVVMIVFLISIITSVAADVPNKHYDKVLSSLMGLTSRNPNVALAKDNASYFTDLFLSPDFSPPLGSSYVPIQRVRDGDCDILRLTYRSGDYWITISQIFSMLLCQIDLPASKNDNLLSIKEVEELMGRCLNKRELKGYFIVRNPEDGMVKKLTDPSGNGRSWWQKPGHIGFYLVKGDGKPSSRPLTLDMGANAHWFTESKQQENNPGYWKRLNSPELVLTQMIAPKFDPFIPLELTSALLIQRWVIDNSQPPKGLRYVSIPLERTNGNAVLQLSYKLNGQTITVRQTSTVTIIQVEKPGLDYLAPLSDEETEKLVQQLFRDSDGVKILTTNATATMAEGFAKVAAESKAPWLNRLHWWQDSGRVIFYLPQDATK